MSRWHRRAVVVAVAVAVLHAATGCTSWVVQYRPLPEVMAERPGKRLRVGVAGERVELDRPRLEGDTLFGTRRWSGGQDRRAVPVADIDEVSIERFSPGRTLLLVAIAGAAVGVFFGIVAIGMAHE